VTTSDTISDDLACFHPTLRSWFLQTFGQATPAQAKAWPVIAAGNHTLLLAPTGSGKTLAAFLVAIDRIMFGRGSPRPLEAERGERGENAPNDARGNFDRGRRNLPVVDRGGPPGVQKGVRVLYISPLKALGVDVERNLRSPIAGVRRVAEREGAPHRVPTVAVRSGDTPPAERNRLNRKPPDILITTPESLYLILTAKSRDILKTVETVIVDEIHSLVGNKRGAHLFVSLERLEDLCCADDGNKPSRQRIGLSATQRPLEEIARLLGGAESGGERDGSLHPRPVEIVEAGRGKQLDLRIEVPVEDMARLAEPDGQWGPAAAGPSVPSIWPSIHPRLVELIRQHRSTMIFVNSRRLAERLAAAINELADQRCPLDQWIDHLVRQRRIIEIRIAGESGLARI
jgi:ATP-dependent Lhr-like helicase